MPGRVATEATQTLDDDEEAKTLVREDDDDPIPGMSALLRENLQGELHDELEVIGKWEVRRLLGRGGFGRVYEAWHPDLDHPVAIKVLDAGRGGPAARQRFLEEARLLAGMSSEHLVRAWDYGELPDGSPYFVMDLVRGQTLRRILAERLPVWRALEIVEEILEGLAEVHRCGVVHGDIKPENIMVGDEDGKARLLDFGLAQTSVEDDEGLGGTPPYMAPEILLDRAQASARTDVYSMGVVLYEMLTGRLPRGHFDMGLDKIRRAWSNKPKVDPVRMYCKDLSESFGDSLATLDQLVMETLCRDPTRRFRSAHEMLIELSALRPRLSPMALAPTLEPNEGEVKSARELRTTDQLSSVESSRRWLRLAPLLAAVSAIIVVSGMGWWAWTHADDDPKPKVVAPPLESERESIDALLKPAEDGILVAVSRGATQKAQHVHGEICQVLGGDRLKVDGGLRVHCTAVAMTDVQAVLDVAEDARVRVVVFVDDELDHQIQVHSTSHHGGNQLLAHLDGLPLPAEPSALAQVTPVLKTLVGAHRATDVPIPALDWNTVGARWVVLAEWMRVQQGHRSPEDLERRTELRQVLVRMFKEARERGQDQRSAGFYRDIAELLWASSAPCVNGEPSLRELSVPDEHEPAIRVSALLGQAECILVGPEAASHAQEAADSIAAALEVSGSDDCVRLAAVGTISWIDRWHGDDVLWDAHQAKLPSPDECEPATWSKVFAIRGDALVARGRYCEAASAYARAYGSLRQRVDLLLNWAEYAWMCKPDTPQPDLLDELHVALASEHFGRPAQRVSIAYMLWWLTRDPVDARRMLEHHTRVKEGDVALLDGVASGLELEICKGVLDGTCSWRILSGPKRQGDRERLLESLGIR